MSSFTPPDMPASGEAAHAQRGQLQIFLGYAAGVGKTYRMLEEAQHRKRLGKDIVIGYFEPHGRKDTIAKTAGLEMIPTKTVRYRGVTFQEMDTGAVIARHPEICVVDELAHANAPGCERCKRWEDVQVILDAGIDVMTNLNIQHLESLNDQIFSVTGVRVRETVPDWFVTSASEIVMVDATTEALINRLKRGVIYPPEKAQRAMENFFKESTLAFLRELALRQTAHELDVRGTSEQAAAADASSAAAATPRREAILIYVTDARTAAMLIRRGRRMADYLGADCTAVCVLPRRADDGPPATVPEFIQMHLKFATSLHIATEILESDDPAEAILKYVHGHAITQVFLSRPDYSWTRVFRADTVMRIVRKARDVRVIIVADRRRV